MAASSSTASHSNNNQWYDVFINHRGPDTKETFARPLYLRLLKTGLKAFLDKEEMQPGYNFPSQIIDAIGTASVHIAIFSPRYAESNWCLDELVYMLESKAPIIPVFYRVKPSEVRWTQGKDGTYARALQQLAKKKTDDPETHKKKLRYDSNTIEKWTNALSRVADNSGFELQTCNGDELEVLDKVVGCISKMVKKTDLHVAHYPTGLDEKLKHFEDTVILPQEHQSGKSQIFGIVGLGGVGKTTLAKEFFNRKNSDYHRSCFLSNVRDHGAKGSLNLLQTKLLQCLTKSDQQVDTVDEGKGMLIGPLESSNALIIVDDVDDADQVNALLPILTHGIRSSSLILITSRDKHVLRSSRVEKSSIYQLTGLNPRHSRELFCSYAFSQPYPNPGFESLVDKFLDSCDGLPLSLKVIGARLYEREIADWEDELRSLQQILPSEIKQILRISYHSLNKYEKQIFLDIVCFFIGQNRDTAIRIWDGSGLNGRLCFQNLEDKNLVEVNSLNEIHMHGHIRDMGRDIADESELPRRLWHWTENVIDDLLQQSSAITVRGVRMALSEYHVDADVYSTIRMRRLQLLDTEDALLNRILNRVESPNLIWLRWNKCPSSSLPSSIPMKNLRVLQVSGSQLKTLWQEELQVPLQLRELEIFAPLLNIPKSIGQLKHLERFVLDHIEVDRHFVDVKITKLPEEFCDLQSLKALVLRNCSEMVSLPTSFGDLSNLQHIDLAGCIKLKKIPISFRKLTKLKYLDLRDCNNVTLRSETLGKISTLEYIDLSNCKKIEMLPQQLAHQRSLVTLKLRGTDIKELASGIAELLNLEVLQLGSPFLERLPSSLGDLRNLKELTIWGCKKLKCLPPSVGDLRNLQELTIWGSEELKYLPASLGDLKNLKELTISQCEELKFLPASVGRLSQLTKLALYNCPLNQLPLDSSIVKCMPRLRELSLEKLKISELPFSEGVFRGLEILHILGCNDLVKVGTLPSTLLELEFISCSSLRKINGISALSKLERLVFDGCPKIETVPSMETFVSLQRLWITWSVKQKSIRGLAQLRKLTSFYVFDCPLLEQLEGVEHCKLLRQLYILDCPKLQWGEGILEQVRQQVEDCWIASGEEVREHDLVCNEAYKLILLDWRMNIFNL